VPVPHFGLALSVEQFHALADRLKAAGIKFIIEPHLRFVGKPGEQVLCMLELLCLCTLNSLCLCRAPASWFTGAWHFCTAVVSMADKATAHAPCLICTSIRAD
jgi:hypothetical protein